MVDFLKKHLFSIKITGLLILSSLVSPAQVKDTSFIYLYINIFSLSCAIPACHDGSFEPNFSSITSSYNTLVYHKVTKNNEKKSFTYRVVPYDAANSVLYERISNCCFVNDNDRMPFTVGDTLSLSDIMKIRNWIDEGAKSPDAKVYSKPADFLPAPSVCEIFVNDSMFYRTSEFKYDSLVVLPFSVHTSPSSLALKFKGSPPSDVKKSDLLAVYVEVSIDDSKYHSAKSFLTTQKGNDWECVLDNNSLEKNTILFFRLRMEYSEGIVIYYPDANTETYKKQTWSLILKD